MRPINRKLFVGMALILLAGAGLQAQPRGRWQYLGEAHVDGARDHDNISVSGGTFRAIQMRVQNAAIEFDRVIVHYGNGDGEPVAIRSVIPAGGQTRAIDLPGDRRVIRSVELFYGKARSDWGRRRPKVRLFGLR